MNYTKGEWKVSGKVGAYDYTVSSDLEYPIARIMASKEDAYLISAAPDMYEALRHTEIMLSNIESAGIILNQQMNLLKIEVNKALAKAEGK